MLEKIVKLSVSLSVKSFDDSTNCSAPLNFIIFRLKKGVW